MSLPPQLVEDLEGLRLEGHDVSGQRDGESPRVFVLFERYVLPPGWSRGDTRLLLITDISYPNSKLDMFWVAEDVLLAGGKVPQAAEAIESYLGITWRRFSWHVQKWNPAIDNVCTYLGTVNARLAQLK